MINKQMKEVMKTEYTLVSIICDVCGKNYYRDDLLEIQEFTHIRHTGGYDSVFGDEESIECDICQHCLKELLEGKYRVVS